jgi:hypothetical protein
MFYYINHKYHGNKEMQGQKDRKRMESTTR